MRNYQLDAADVHADGAGAFLGAVLAELDEPIAREILQPQRPELRLQGIEDEGLRGAGQPAAPPSCW